MTISILTSSCGALVLTFHNHIDNIIQWLLLIQSLLDLWPLLDLWMLRCLDLWTVRSLTVRSLNASNGLLYNNFQFLRYLQPPPSINSDLYLTQKLMTFLFITSLIRGIIILDHWRLDGDSIIPSYFTYVAPEDVIVINILLLLTIPLYVQTYRSWEWR